MSLRAPPADVALALAVFAATCLERLVNPDADGPSRPNARRRAP